MAITTREQEMLDLQDAGLPPAEIAARMGIKVSSVARALGALSWSPRPDVLRANAIARGSEQLRQAVVALGGHR